MQLAKPGVDVGVFTSRLEEIQSFYEREVGLPYEELLKVGGGVHQHRLGLNGSVFKLNHSRDPLDRLPTCLRRLVVARQGPEPARILEDPDGLEIELVPAGEAGVETIGIHWASRDPDRLGELLAKGFGAVPAGEARWRLGTTIIQAVEDPQAEHPGGLRAHGFRYVTVQVTDVRTAHAHLLDTGWTEAAAPTRLADVAMVSFVRDPDGVWVEVSQRASLTGRLPEP